MEKRSINIKQSYFIDLIIIIPREDVKKKDVSIIGKNIDLEDDFLL